MNFKRSLVLGLMALPLIAACSQVPDYSRPAVGARDSFSQQSAAKDAIQADKIAQDWWTAFGSAELNGLIDRALANNLDIRAAVARVEQARADAKIAGADLLPSIEGGLGAGREFENPEMGGSSADTRLGASLAVAYEVDLFGGNKAGRDSARASLKGRELEREAVNLMVMADVARTYFNLVNAYERLKIADDNIRNARELLDIVEQRLEAGAASRLDIAQQKSALATTEATRASVARLIETNENALAVLLGEPPKNITVGGRSLSKLKVPAIAAGQPSRLLDRRPDIRAAEQDLIAANADIGVARAALFPSLTLGLDASAVRLGLGDPTATALSIASALAVPIFQGGRLQGGVEKATARQNELAETYRATVLISFREVEDALASVKSAQAREKALAVAASQATEAYNLSRELYDAGSTDFQTLLDVQRDELAAKDAYAQSRNERLAAAVDLFRALGGGWGG